MQTAVPPEPEPSANADQVTLATHSSSVDLSLVPRVRAEPTPTVHPLAGLLFANVSPAIPEIHIPTASLIRVQVVLAGREQSVITTEEPLSVNVLPTTLETLMSAADWIPAVKMPADPMLTVPVPERGQCVLAEEVTSEAHTAGPDAEPTPVLMEFVVQGPSVKTTMGDQCAHACLDTRATPTRAASRESAMKTLTADPRELARTTNVWTPVLCPVDRERTAPCRTMWPYAGVPEEPQGTRSTIADGSQGKRFVLLVGLTQTVRLDRMIGQSVDANQPTLEILCKAVDTNVTLTEIADRARLATGSTTDVKMPVVEVLVEKMPTARQSTTEPSVPAHPTSLGTPFLGVIQNVPDTATVLPTRRASS